MYIYNRTVLIVGATGYLGQHLVRTYSQAGYWVRALARDESKLSSVRRWVNEAFIGEATDPASIATVCDGVDLVVSALGITRQTDQLNYADVDYQANKNILDCALQAGVERFAYVHILNADKMADVPVVKAKTRFVEALTDAPILSTILCPSGFFSDLSEVFKMAAQGRVYVLGSGRQPLSPISGTDLAQRCLMATEAGEKWVDVGGPDTFDQCDIASLAFEVLGAPKKMTHIPLWAGHLVCVAMQGLGQKHISGPIALFLAASAIDMSAPAFGKIRLIDTFQSLRDEMMDKRKTSTNLRPNLGRN
jgi:uncharacterized protein YbjT (DUF2867 family)